MPIVCYFYYYSTVLKLEIWNSDISNGFYIIWDCLIYHGILCLYIWSFIHPFNFFDKLFWKSYEDCIESVVFEALGRIKIMQLGRKNKSVFSWNCKILLTKDYKGSKRKLLQLLITSSKAWGFTVMYQH